jgi:aminopeptidase N
MLRAPERDLRITWFRALQAIAETPRGRAALKEILAGKLAVPGAELRPLDRWNFVTALVAVGDPDAEALYATEERRDRTGDGVKYAWVAAAARPDPRTKQRYFDDYLHDPSRPEDWIVESLAAFNYWNQSELTAPYLEPALEALPRIKVERKIFFLLGWLERFIDGQQSEEARARVHGFVDTAALDADLRLKILQAVDELDRTVRIRKAFPG